MASAEYYTYAYLRKNGTPYYIGKGKGDRCFRNGGRNCKKPSDALRILILKTGLTEEEAFRHEIYMIFVFGKKCNGTGILHNLNDGGEGQSGFVFSEESLEKMKTWNRNRPAHLNNNLKHFTERCPEHQKKAFARLLELNPDHQSEAGKIGGSKRATQKEFKEMTRANLDKMNNTLWEDPEHPDLGQHRAGHLVRKQKKLGYPHGKQNRSQVQPPSYNV